MNLEKCMKVANQASFAFCLQYQDIEHDEARSEAYLIMLKAIETWDPLKGRSLYSWIAFLVHRELRKNFIKDTYNICVFDTENVEENSLSAEDLVLFLEKQSTLSDLSRKIIRMLSSSGSKQKIKDALKQAGISGYKIRYAFKEIKLFREEVRSRI